MPAEFAIETVLIAKVRLSQDRFQLLPAIVIFDGFRAIAFDHENLGLTRVNNLAGELREKHNRSPPRVESQTLEVFLENSNRIEICTLDKTVREYRLMPFFKLISFPLTEIQNQIARRFDGDILEMQVDSLLMSCRAKIAHDD